MSVSDDPTVSLVVTCLADDRLELRFERDPEHAPDLFTIALYRHDKGRAIQVDRNVVLNAEAARQMFSFLGVVIHTHGNGS